MPTQGGRRYYTLYTDDGSRYRMVYLMRKKSETFATYQKLHAFYNTQKGAPIKIFHTNRGGEFLSEEFSQYLAKNGTTCKLTVHDTPEYNGVSERSNHTLLERVRAMLSESGLPTLLWGEAVSHAIYLMN